MSLLSTPFDSVLFLWILGFLTFCEVQLGRIAIGGPMLVGRQLAGEEEALLLLLLLLLHRRQC